MDKPFTRHLCDLSDSLGVGLYQRFSLSEAALFLRCSVKSVRKLQRLRKIAYIQLTDNQIEFFGYQLIEYLSDSIAPLPSSQSPRQPQSSQQPQPSQDRIIRSKEVQSLTTLSRTTLWRLERDGLFPARISICSGLVGWRLSEVVQWIETRSRIG